jgi:hypothetical protein
LSDLFEGLQEPADVVVERLDAAVVVLDLLNGQVFARGAGWRFPVGSWLVVIEAAVGQFLRRFKIPRLGRFILVKA